MQKKERFSEMLATKLILRKRKNEFGIVGIFRY
jgi:hypothetical protein